MSIIVLAIAAFIIVGGGGGGGGGEGSTWNRIYLGFFLFVDEDECILEPCKDGRCKNTFGSFMCTCNTGYTVDETGLSCIGTFVSLIQ